MLATTAQAACEVGAHCVHKNGIVSIRMAQEAAMRQSFYSFFSHYCETYRLDIKQKYIYLFSLSQIPLNSASCIDL